MTIEEFKSKLESITKCIDGNEETEDKTEEEKAYNRGFRAGIQKGIEIGKRACVDQDYLDFEDGKITLNEYRQRKGLKPINGKEV